MRPLHHITIEVKHITIEGMSSHVNRIVSFGAPGSLFYRSLELRCWGSYTGNTLVYVV